MLATRQITYSPAPSGFLCIRRGHMKKLTLHLPKYRLAMEFKLIKRRKGRFDEPLVPTASNLRKKYHVGNMAHKLLRHIFEHKAVKKILGTNIALMVVASSFMPTNTLGNSTAADSMVISEKNIPLTTIKAIQNPVAEVKITQGYKFYHPGLDLDGVTGDPIRPIKNGVVIDVSISKFAYGKSVIIDHGDGLTSLYAHLSNIEVTEGQKVDTTTEIGQMGATGRSFGDHLHLEVRDGGVAINPLTVLPL
jgi:murein DD-endopeptidase MepM/ murein hydrolase activator NlpD